MRDYFLVYYDVNTQQIIIDDMEAMNRFPDGLMLDTKSGRWVDQGDHGDLDAEAAKAVKSCMDLYNSVLKNIEKSP